MVEDIKSEITHEPFEDVYNEINTVTSKYNRIYEDTWKNISVVIIPNKGKLDQLIWGEYYFKLYPSYIHNSALNSLHDSVKFF